MSRTIAAIALAGLLVAGCANHQPPRSAKSEAWHQAMRSDLTDLCEDVRVSDKIMADLPWSRVGWTAYDQVKRYRAKATRDYNALMAEVQPVLQGGTYGLPAHIDKYDLLPDCLGRFS